MCTKSGKIITVELKHLVLTTFVLFVFFGCTKKPSGQILPSGPLQKETLAYLNELASHSDDLYAVKKTIATANIDSLQRFTKKLVDYREAMPELSKSMLVLLADSISKAMNIRTKPKIHVRMDSDYISPLLMQHNDSLAFKALNESAWKNLVSIHNYQEYIRPYKLSNEILDNWRDTLYASHQTLLKQYPQLNNLDSLYAYHMASTYFQLGSNLEMRSDYPAEENYSWLDLSREGDCNSQSRYLQYHLRAAGAPATFDYIPNWGNRPYAKHSIVGLANKEKQLNPLLENTNDPTNLVNSLNAAMSNKYTYVYTEDELPRHLYVQHEKTIPKVYRQTWTNQAAILDLVSESPQEELYFDLIKFNMVDVTAQYLTVADVEFKRRLIDNYQLGYLATFGINGWIPVAFSQFNWLGKCLFRDMGKNILYMPMVCSKNAVKPYGDPFILKNTGAKRILTSDKKTLIDMELYRKFPMFSYTATHAINFKGCKIEGANQYHFEDAKLLHKIDYFPFFTQQIDFEIPDTFQYIHLIAPVGQTIRIAEIECFEDSCGVFKKLEDVNYKNGVLKGNYRKAFDGDLNSYLTGRWVRLDFGSSKAISRIRFCPRNDTNSIIPGNTYELFFWDKGWVSAGVKEASSFSLNYSNIPSGTMYWLKCLNGGKEERIFTYENNRQVWW